MPDMKEVHKIMMEYFKTVTPEQFEQDLLDAGILECPDKNDCPINNFGQLQWDVGTCVDCSVENKELFNACWDEGHKNIKPKLTKKLK